MCEKVINTLNKRNDFIELLDKDIRENTKLYHEHEIVLHNLKDTLNNVKELGKYPEHTALIPLCKHLFLPGKLVHTGEFYINKSAYPNSYSMLQSLNQTITRLENEITEQNIIVKKAKFSKNQLEERMKLLKIDEAEISEEMANMPKEIMSDKGVALKVGEFYEILEFEKD